MWGSPGVGQNLRPFLSTDFSASDKMWLDRFTTLSKSDRRLNQISKNSTWRPACSITLGCLTMKSIDMYILHDSSVGVCFSNISA